MKVFLLAFNQEQVPRQTVLEFLDSRAEIVNWQAILPGAIILAAEHSARELGTLIHVQFPKLLYTVTELTTTTTSGRLYPLSWEFLFHPRRPGEPFDPARAVGSGGSDDSGEQS